VPAGAAGDPNNVLVKPVGPANTTLPPVDKPAEAPDQVNDIKPGTAQQQTAADAKKKKVPAPPSDGNSSQAGGLPATNARVTALEGAVVTLRADLAAEIAARKAADTALSNQLGAIPLVFVAEGSVNNIKNATVTRTREEYAQRSQCSRLARGRDTGGEGLESLIARAPMPHLRAQSPRVGQRFV